MRSLLVLLSLVGLVIGCSEKRTPSSVQPSPQSLPSGPPSMTQGRAALELGEPLPLLSCTGWVNGVPPHLEDAKHGLVVVDVWGQWCSEVPKAVPGLKQLYEEYHPHGVAFVSLTTDDSAVVEQFVKAHGIPWSSGYGMTRALVESIGASNVGVPMPGYEVKPILYLIDSLGNVVWSDHNQRMDHRDEDKVEVIFALEQALRNELETPSQEVNESS